MCAMHSPRKHYPIKARMGGPLCTQYHSWGERQHRKPDYTMSAHLFVVPEKLLSNAKHKTKTLAMGNKHAIIRIRGWRVLFTPPLGRQNAEREAYRIM